MEDTEKKLNVSSVFKIAPRTLTGGLSPHNKDAIDWGWQSLIAYGCHNIVVVADVQNVQSIQTLEKHRSHVVKVKWNKENYYHDLSKPYCLKLASADTIGNIIVWDVNLAIHTSVFSDGNRPVLDMEWLHNQDSCQDLLVVLHQPCSLILWNTVTGTKVWKKTYSESLLSFAFDPFDATNMAFLATDCILFIDDFSLQRLPTSNGRKFFISTCTNSHSTSLTNLSSIGRDSIDTEPKSPRSRFRSQLTKILVGVDIKPKTEDKITLNECLQLTFHNSCRHHLLLLYPRELLILDLEIYQTVGIIAVDRNASPLTRVISCMQRDVLYFLHENGSISVRVRQKASTYTDLLSSDSAQVPDTVSLVSTDAYLEVGYDLRCQSDSIRVTKNSKIMGFVACPVSEKKIALLCNDGRLLVLELQILPSKKRMSNLSPLRSPNMDSSLNFKSEIISGDGDQILPPLSTIYPHPRLSLSDSIAPCLYSNSLNVGSSIMFRLYLTGLLPSVAQSPHVIKMCPPLTTSNWKVYHPYLAVGNNMGSVQIFNLATGSLEKEFSLHAGPIRGIEWTGLTSFLTYSYSNLSGQSVSVKNEIVKTDILTGRTQHLRTDKGDESPIHMMKVSYLKQYFIVAFKEKPFELWDLRSMTSLRTMPKKFPTITALEWSPIHNTKKLRKRLLSHQDSFEKSGSKDLKTPQSGVSDISANDSSCPLIKEQFVFTDANGQLYHFCVEGNTIKDGTKLPPDGNMKSVTSIAWKNDQIVLGDVDGNLNLWDLTAKVSRSVPTHRGLIKKIRFAPGRGVMKLLVLFSDGIDIWDAKEVELVDKVRSPKEMAKIHSVDWAGSDKLVAATGDGCIRVFSLNSQTCSSPVSEYEKAEPTFLPHILPPKIGLSVRCLLQHQPWTTMPYDINNISDIHGFSKECREIISSSLSALDSNVANYLHLCPFGTANRCLQVARLFGDESEIHFWTVALHYLRTEKFSSNSKLCKKPTASRNTGNVSRDSNKLVDRLIKDIVIDQPLDLCYDMLCDSSTYLRFQLDRLALHDNKRTTYEHTSKCVENLMMLGQTDRAVQLLLETEPEHRNHYTDSLRACLAATIQSSETSQSTIKLVATNLIASGSITEGVQLLCLVDKTLDACRYLQSSGKWNEAIWLAKSTMCYKDCGEVLRRYIDYLCTPQINQKSKAILVQLSMGQFEKVIEMLHSMKMFERAVLFVESCMEFGYLNTSDFKRPVIEAAYLDYARHLYSLDNKIAAIYYCDQVNGERLKKEIEILEMDK